MTQGFVGQGKKSDVYSDFDGKLWKSYKLEAE